MTGILIWYLVITSIFLILFALVALVGLSDGELLLVVPFLGTAILIALPILGKFYITVAFACTIVHIVLSIIGLIVCLFADKNSAAIAIPIGMLLVANFTLSIVGIVFASQML